MLPATLWEQVSWGGQPEACGGQARPSMGSLFAVMSSALSRSCPTAEEPYQRLWLIIYPQEPLCLRCRMLAPLSPCPGAPRSPIFHAVATLPGTCWAPGPMAERHPGPSSPRDPSLGQQGTQRGAWACTLPSCNRNTSPPFEAHGGEPAAAAHTGS